MARRSIQLSGRAAAGVVAGRRDRRTGQGPRLAGDAAARRQRRKLHCRRLPHLADDDRVLLARPLRRLQLRLPASGPGLRCAECDPGAPTAAGLRIGDDVAQARRIYGSACVVLCAQGGSWRVTTSTGMLDGYLTAVPDRPTPPVPRVADLSAGSVGCPAASPLAAPPCQTPSRRSGRGVVRPRRQRNIQLAARLQFRPAA
jgi:hypothetical protein